MVIAPPSDFAAFWINRLGGDSDINGLVRIGGYTPKGRPPGEVAIMERAAAYGAYGVFFEARTGDQSGPAQAFVFVSDGPADDIEFAELHKRLWSWGGVPLVYRRTRGLVQLFRCAHGPDFVSRTGDLICNPVRMLQLAAEIGAQDVQDPWWNAERLWNGTLWDDPSACKLLLSAEKSAHRGLVEAVRRLYEHLTANELLGTRLRRRLLILSLLIAYIEQRGALPLNFFERFKSGASRFFHVLSDGPALVRLLAALEERFNGHVFQLDEAERALLVSSRGLDHFRRLVEAREDSGGQLSLWELYSFKDLPVEVISLIYQLFVHETASSVYTPPPLVRLMLEEALSWSRMDRLIANREMILDPSCGSGVFLVEAYKRLVLHWRSRNGWEKPDVEVLRSLLSHLRGFDVEEGAIELAAFSLCLALCDALGSEEIRASVRLFPKLAGHTLIVSCFFEAKEKGLVDGRISVVLGNPPFESALRTPGAQRSYDRYVEEHGPLADKQVAYLFLHDSMELVVDGGVLCMLQQYNLLYNQRAASVRENFLRRWDVREILDFVSIRGLFQKGGADTKVFAIVVEAGQPPVGRRVLHAVFRRSGRADADQGFDIDYYDLHWLSRSLLLKESGPEIWRANLLGGDRTLSFLKRLKCMRTLKQHAEERGWSYGEGFIEGDRGVSRPATHLIGAPLLPSNALTINGIDRSRIMTVPEKPIEGPRSASLFTPPILLVREHADLPHTLWDDGYLTYKNKIVGFAAHDITELQVVNDWLSSQNLALRAYAAGASIRSLTQKATTLSAADVLALPYPADGTLDLSENEMIVAYDVVHHYREFVRLGSAAGVASADAWQSLPDFNVVFSEQINAVYRKLPLRPLEAQRWPGVICQPFVFGPGKVDWSDAVTLKGKLDGLLREQRGTELAVTRIARLYDERFIFLLKPDRLRYWLQSIALRDADDVLADLRAQGF